MLLIQYPLRKKSGQCNDHIIRGFHNLHAFEATFSSQIFQVAVFQSTFLIFVALINLFNKQKNFPPALTPCCFGWEMMSNFAHFLEARCDILPQYLMTNLIFALPATNQHDALTLMGSKSQYMYILCLSPSIFLGLRWPLSTSSVKTSFARSWRRRWESPVEIEHSRDATPIHQNHCQNIQVPPAEATRRRSAGSRWWAASSWCAPGAPSAAALVFFVKLIAPRRRSHFAGCLHFWDAAGKPFFLKNKLTQIEEWISCVSMFFNFYLTMAGDM